MTHFLDSSTFGGSAPEPVGAALQSSIQPTKEQLAIIEAAATTSDNLLISALAGAAKTSTLVMVANDPRLASTSILCLAFNKRIAEEMKARLPSNCVAMTLNSLGHKAWGQKLGRRLNLDARKNFGILKELISKERKDLQDKLWDNFAELNRTLGHAKSQGMIPVAYESEAKVCFGEEDEFFAGLDEELASYEQDILVAALCESIKLSFAGTIDFDDQIYMTTCFGAPLPHYPLTMIDEAQDLSGLNHAMLEAIVDSKRLLAVGDPCQAIYGFRGAHGDSMSHLKTRFNMNELGLSTSFRCPRAVIAEARWRAPHMNAPDWAKEGSVTSLDSWSIDDLTQDAVIICRNNAPIFKLAIALLKEGRYPQIVGNDIGKTLIKSLTKLGDKSLKREEALVAWEIFQRNKISRARPHAKASAEDFCRCLRIFLDKAETLGAAIAYAEHIMNVTGPVKLMTIHKSKGLEFPHLYILDYHLLRMDEAKQSAKNQDRNLAYVAITRSKDSLTYITSDGMIRTNSETDDE